MSINDTIKVAANSMVALLFAKFILNDVPHAVGLMGQVWLEDAWKKTVEYARSRDIDLAGALESSLSEGDIDEESAHGYKVSLAGYFMLASGEASDQTVNDTFSFLYRALIHVKSHYMRSRGYNIETREGYEGLTEEVETRWWNALNKIYIHARDATTRLDKAILIDEIMHEYHVDTTLLDELVGLFMTDIFQAAHELVAALGNAGKTA